MTTRLAALTHKHSVPLVAYCLTHGVPYGAARHDLIRGLLAGFQDERGRLHVFVDDEEPQAAA